MSRKGSCLFVRPRWQDAPVKGWRFPWLMDYLMWIGDEVVFHANHSGMCIHELKEKDATRINVEEALLAKDPIFFFHASHGGPNKLTGQNMSNLICCPGVSPCPDPNHEVLSERITYTISCSSGKQLGPAVIDVQGISFIGYNNLLRICLIQGSDCDNVFKDIWGGGAKVLLDGKTTGEAYNWLKLRYMMWINYWEMRPPTWEKPVMLSVLQDDLDRLTIYGKKSAKISA